MTSHTPALTACAVPTVVCHRLKNWFASACGGARHGIRARPPLSHAPSCASSKEREEQGLTTSQTAPARVRLLSNPTSHAQARPHAPAIISRRAEIPAARATARQQKNTNRAEYKTG